MSEKETLDICGGTLLRSLGRFFMKNTVAWPSGAGFEYHSLIGVALCLRSAAIAALSYKPAIPESVTTCDGLS